MFKEGGVLLILIDCMVFLSSFMDVKRMSMSTVSFLEQLDCGVLYFPLIYDLNGFKAEINRHLLTVSSY